MHWTLIALCLVAAYLLGGVPFAYLAGRLAGKDVRTVGSRNPGAANLFRKVDWRLGLLAGAADIGKGALAVAIARLAGAPGWAVVLAGALAVLGHWYSPYLKFRGGAGLAVAVGTGVGLVPWAGVIGVGLALALIAVIKNVGYGAGLAYCVAIPIAAVLGYPLWAVLGALGLGAVVMGRAQLVDRRLWPFGPHRAG